MLTIEEGNTNSIVWFQSTRSDQDHGLFLCCKKSFLNKKMCGKKFSYWKEKNSAKVLARKKQEIGYNQQGPDDFLG